MTAQRRHAARFSVALAAIIVVFAVGSSSAGAHGGGSAGTETPNYVTAITDPGHPGLRWEVDIAHAKIGLINNTDQTVIVYGYRSEPYLRFDPDGEVWRNTASPSGYVNEDRYGDADIPPTAKADASPVWEPLPAGSNTWYDHRAHWMAREQPTAVAANPDRSHLIDEWAIPLRVGDTDTAVQGDLRWEPDLAWWPPLLALTVGFMFVVVAVLIATKPAEDRWPEPAGTLAGFIVVVAAANVVRGIDEALNVADTASGQVVVAIGAVVAAAVIIGLANKGRSGHPGGYAALFVAAFLTGYVFGGQSWPEITDPQLVTGLPEWTRRWSIAASYAILAPAALLAVIAGRRYARLPTTLAATPADDPHLAQ